MGWVEEKTGIDVTPDLGSASEFWEWIEDPFEDFVDLHEKAIQEVFEWLVPLPDAPSYADQAGVLINKKANNAYIPIVYGERRTGGTLAFKGVSGTDNEYLHIVLVVSEGEINQIGDVYIDDIISTDSRYTGKVDIWKYTGTTTQAADSTLVSAFAGWTSAAQGKSVAYIHARFLYDKEVFRGTPRITCDIQGKKVLDFRNSPNTTVYSSNPALCIYDYLVNAISGKGLDSSLINIDSFVTAANYCDNQIAQDTSSPQILINRFECNGVIDTGVSIRSNLNELLKSCRGHLTYFNGQYHLIIDKDESSVYSLNVDNIVGQWSITGQDKRSRFNRVKAEFPNPNRNWQPDIAVFDSTTYRTSDNGSLLEKSIRLPFETNYYRALRHATFVCNKSRNALVVSLTTTRNVLRVELGQVVDITHDYPGWTGKLFRVVFMEPMSNGNVRLTLNFHDSATYSFATPAQIDAVPSTDLPDPYTVIAPSGLTLNSGEEYLTQGTDGTIVSRIKAAWTATTDPYADDYEVQAKRSDASPATWLPQGKTGSKDTVEFFISPVEDAVDYDVRVRAINTLQYSSSWITSTNHTVIGKSSPPNDVTGFVAAQNGDVAIFRWIQVTNVDLAGYEIRYGPVGSAWEDATPLTSVTRGTNITTADIPPGTWDTFIKSVDTSLNYSTNADSDSLTFVNSYDIITEQSEHPDFLGVKNNLVKHWMGKLVPQSQTRANAVDWEVFDTFVYNPYDTGTYDAIEIDIDFDDAVRTWADATSVLGPGETGVANPTIQLDWRTESGSYDGYENWHIGNRTARYFKYRLLVDTTNGVYYVSEFNNTVDNLEAKTTQTISISAGSSPSGYLAVTFDRQYHVAPQVKPTYIGSNSYLPVVDNITTTGCDAYLFDSTTGAGATGTVELEITGT